MSQRTVTINGRMYDVHTGLPVQNTADERPARHASVSPSHAMHQAAQKSQTLNRRIVKNTATRPAPATKSTAAERPIQKSAAITKFAPHPQGIKPAQRTIKADIGPIHHPIAAKARQQAQMKNTAVKAQQTAAAPAPKPSQIIKQEAIAEAMQNTPAKNDAQHKPAKKRKSRLLSIASASMALLLLGGYLTYLNMPSLSVRVAAAAAGVDASYPTYRPDGYSLNGPVAYSDGEVSMKFAANAGPQNFTVAQTSSSWDSSAVFDNYVKEKAGENYITYSERGLTIYTFGGNAAWVNNGILYTINGDAPLSGDQIRRIATSM